jgi:Domain of unknown function (DUF4410)/Protein of unknown function (DUF3313)
MRRYGIKRNFLGLFCLSLFVLVSLTSCFPVGPYRATPRQSHQIATLTASERDIDAGLVGIATGFDIKKYDVVVVDRIKVNDSELKDEESRKLAAELSDFFQAELVRQFRETGLFRNVLNLNESDMPADKGRTLKVQGAITRLAHGSAALRYWIGGGAGQAEAEAELYFLDVPTGEFMLIIADRREVAFGARDNRVELRQSVDDMVQAVGRFLVRLSKGAAPCSRHCTAA